MELISIVIGFFVGLLLFYLLNTWFEIWYLGFRAIGSTFTGCWIAGFLIVYLLFYSLKYVIAILAVVAVLARIFRKKKPKDKPE